MASKDPYLLLGSGMIAYKDLLWTLTVVFTVLSLIMLPAMMFYGSYSGIKSPKSLMQYSLGNMGFSHAECTILPLGAGDGTFGFKVPLNCSYGVVGKIHAFGLNPKNLYPNNFCEISDKNPDNNNVECSDALDREFINNTLHTYLGRVGGNLLLSSDRIFKDTVP